tara:strand:- start:2579 stop:3142 length:564 start_codon:yes stop_codon:yes gene_type:complete
MTFLVFFDSLEKHLIMKTFKLVVLFSAFILACSCSKDEVEESASSLKTTNSQICTNVQGASAIYWDFSHGLPTPLRQVPLLKNPGQQFVHSQLPLLGFTIPQGFNAFEVTNPLTATLGVNVVRNDNNVVYRWVPNTRVLALYPQRPSLLTRPTKENNNLTRDDSTSITITANDSSNDNAFNTTLLFL